MPPTKHCHEPQSELISTAKVQPPKVDATVAVYPTGCLGRKTPIATPPPPPQKKKKKKKKKTMPGSHKIPNELMCRLGEKGPRSGVLSPAPCEKYAKEELNIFTTRPLNTNGLQNKKIELVNLLQDQEVHIALLQETILPKKKNTTEIIIPGYTKEPCTCKKPLAPTVKASCHLLEMTLLE